MKGRSEAKSLIILLDTDSKLQSYVKEVPEIAYDLVEFAEYPLTIIYSGAKNLASNVISEDGSIGIRLVDDLFLKKIISKINKPLVSTSANFSGEKSPMKFADISKEIIEAVDFVAEENRDKVSEFSGSSIIRIWADGRVKVIRE